MPFGPFSKGERKKKPKNLIVENIINSLSDKQSKWTPIVLYRSVEKELIQTLYSLKAQESSRPIYGNIKGSDYSLFKNKIDILSYLQKDLTKKITANYHSDCDYLKCEKPNKEPKATENISLMVEMIEDLKEWNIFQADLLHK